MNGKLSSKKLNGAKTVLIVKLANFCSRQRLLNMLMEYLLLVTIKTSKN